MSKFIILSAILAVMTVALGCSRPATYGSPISNRNLTAIKDIVMSSKDYVGKTVTVKGKIALECETGCWVNLQDGGAVIYVDLAPSGFALPQKVGRSATIEGKVSIESGKLTLIGKGVEVK